MPYGKNQSLPAGGGTEDTKMMAKHKPNVLYNCRESSTNRAYFMQNKANVKIGKMNISSILTKDYENKRLYRCGENKPKTNPIPEKPK